MLSHHLTTEISVLIAIWGLLHLAAKTETGHLVVKWGGGYYMKPWLCLWSYFSFPFFYRPAKVDIKQGLPLCGTIQNSKQEERQSSTKCRKLITRKWLTILIHWQNWNGIQNSWKLGWWWWNQPTLNKTIIYESPCNSQRVMNMTWQCRRLHWGKVS